MESWSESFLPKSFCLFKKKVRAASSRKMRLLYRIELEVQGLGVATTETKRPRTRSRRAPWGIAARPGQILADWELSATWVMWAQRLRLWLPGGSGEPRPARETDAVQSVRTAWVTPRYSPECNLKFLAPTLSRDRDCYSIPSQEVLVTVWVRAQVPVTSPHRGLACYLHLHVPEVCLLPTRLLYCNLRRKGEDDSSILNCMSNSAICSVIYLVEAWCPFPSNQHLL